MLTNVQVLAGATSVARFGDVVLWYETGAGGGGAMLSQVFDALQGVASGSVPSRTLGARLAAVLNGGGPDAVPALVAATPEGTGLRVVVHGWGSVVADGIHVPKGWVDQVIDGRHTFFVGRNTMTAAAPVEGSPLDLEDGVVPGDGVSFVLTPAAAVGSAPLAATPSTPASLAPLVEPPAYEPPPSDPPPAPDPTPATTAAPPPPGRLVLDDGCSAALERTCVLGSAPHGSPAVQTGVALPLTVLGPGVAPVHVEIRVEPGNVAVRDLGAAPTFVLVPGGTTWAPLGAGQISDLAPGSRIAMGQRTLSYEVP